MLQTANCRLQTVLIVTFLTLRSSDLFNSYAVQFMIFDIGVEFLVNAVKFIPGAVVFIKEVNLGLAVTVDTPSHT